MKKLWILTMTRREQMLKVDKIATHAFHKGMVGDQRIPRKITRSWSVDFEKDKAATIMLLKK